MLTDRLQDQVGKWMRPTVTIDAENSLRVAIEKMRGSGQEMIPVTFEGKYIGTLTQNGILRAVVNSAESSCAVKEFIDQVPTVKSYQTAAEAIRQLSDGGTQVVVTDDSDVVAGVFLPATLFGKQLEIDRPLVVGGMATPFGVYLTNGAVSGGKKGWNLVATGVFLFTIFLSGNAISTYLLNHTAKSVWTENIANLIPFVALVIVFRFFPISGFHAAEHQVVHAIEQGEELDPEIVSRMTRVHPRCGTNLAVAVSMFMGIFEAKWIPWPDVRMLVAVIATLFLWRPIGSFMQKNITTRPANAKQLESGIAAGKELLANYAVATHRTAGPLRRIFNSGMLHVMAGSFGTYAIVSLVAMAFGIPFGQLLRSGVPLQTVVSALSTFILVLAIIVAIVFSLLVLITGKGDAMSGGGSVRTSFKGKASFDDIISRWTLYLGAAFMALVLAYNVAVNQGSKTSSFNLSGKSTPAATPSTSAAKPDEKKPETNTPVIPTPAPKEATTPAPTK
jgi:protein translocase SecG subunit